MEVTDDHTPTRDHHSSVDTSRPFRSVKEAVAVFGERLFVGETYSAKPLAIIPKQETQLSLPSTPKKSRADDKEKNNTTLENTLRKLEAELQETKMELRLLQERESETEVALASLNAELHKNMSKMAKAEAVAAAKAAAAERSIVSFEGEKREEGLKDERGKRAPTLAQRLSISEMELSFIVGRRKERRVMKKKPIVPLVGDLFSRKKGSLLHCS